MSAGDLISGDDAPGTERRSPYPAPPRPTLVSKTRPGGRLATLGIDVVPLTVLVDVAALAATRLVVQLTLLSSVLLAVVIIALNAVGGHYKARIAPSLLDELPGLAARALVAGALVSAVRLQLTLPVQDGPVFAALVFIVFASIGRAVGYPLMRRRRKMEHVGRPTIIIGCGRVGNQLAATLLEHPEYGLRPMGFVDDDPLVSPSDRHVQLLGGTEALTRLLIEHRIQSVIVAFTTSPESLMVDMIRRCDRLSCEIFFVPRLYELHGTGPDTELIWGLPLTRLSRASYRTLTWRTKRVFDFVLAGLGLVLLSPVLAVCAVAVRIEGGPGVIFKQERVGLDGRRFTIYKFRSLKPSDDEESSQLWNIGGDPRMGPVGRWLRLLSLDELPQLWNVVRGDMSLVGPRPERPLFVDEFANRFPRYVARHRVPVGLTGWAQINGLRGDTDIADRASFDNYYIENWSMWADVKIMLRTVGQMLGGRGQ